MRKGFALMEMLAVLIILPFILIVLAGLFTTLISDIPRSYRVIQANTSLLSMLRQMQRDIDAAKQLPESFAEYATDDELLLSAYPACDVFVLPSEYEAFGLVLLEAMSCEKPCVATNVGGVPEVVEDGKTGLLVEYGNPVALASAIIKLLGDEEKRRSMGMAGRKRVIENFTWPKIVDKIEGVYRELV